MNKKQLSELARKYLNGTASEQEKKRLHDWYDASENMEQGDLPEHFFITSEETGNRIFEKVMDDIDVEKPGTPAVQRKRIVPFNTIVRWMAAASIITLLFISVRHYIQGPDTKKETAFIQPEKKTAVRTVMPGGNKAQLVLPGGEIVILEDIENGTIKNKSGLQITKQDGRLFFNAAVQKNNMPNAFNTVYTPRGGQYQVLLPDGSQVWLNAASSLRFPASFTGGLREVELTGEGYFEIAKNPAMPFHVKVNNMLVEVLGTHFNVMSYPDENEVNTTLLEGAVKVHEGNATRLLKPGEQASLNREAGKIKVSEVDVDQAIAWKNGLFQFDGVTLQSVMKQLARWYNIEVIYKGNFSAAHFRGMISRSVDLAQVTKMLEMTGELHFKIEDKTVTVTP